MTPADDKHQNQTDPQSSSITEDTILSFLSEDRDMHMPAMTPQETDTDDGIFLHWPGEEDGPFTDEELPEDDAEEEESFSFTGKASAKKKKKKQTQKQKEASDPSGQASAQYAFRRAARSDYEESHNRRHRKIVTEADSDNEAVLSSLKYRKHTKTIRERLLRRVLILLLVAGFLCGFVLYFFRLQHLTFDNLRGYTTEEVFSALDIRKNMFIFSVRESSIDKKLTVKFPYIQKVDVEYSLPNTVHLVFSEDCALFYTQMYDEYFVISESMRVLARYNEESELPADLLKITLPAVSYAVVGHELRFFDETYTDFLNSFLDEVENAAIYEKINAMDLSNRYDLQLEYDDSRLTINLGSSEDLDTKLLFVKSMIAALEQSDCGTITLITNKQATFSPQTRTE